MSSGGNILDLINFNLSDVNLYLKCTIQSYHEKLDCTKLSWVDGDNDYYDTNTLTSTFLTATFV